MKKETDGVSEDVFPGKTAASPPPESDRLHPDGWDRGACPGVSLVALPGLVIDVHFTDEPDPVINALGCRGVGEIGITGAAAAVANAVSHAAGKRIRHLPIIPDKLL